MMLTTKERDILNFTKEKPERSIEEVKSQHSPEVESEKVCWAHVP
jgi:hypothetical protein